MKQREGSLAALLVALPLLLAGVARGQGIDVDGFDPRLDGLPFANTGTFTNPNGNCFGMSLVAIDNYLRRSRVIGPPAAPRETTRTPAASYPAEHALVSRAQTLTGKDSWNVPGLRTRNPLRAMDDPEPIAESLARMAAGGPPEVLLYTNGRGGHASVLYGYVDGMLQVYDPNYPGERIAWPYDPVRGLGPHPKAVISAFYATLTHLSSTPHEQFKTADDLAWLREACRQGARACTSESPVAVETKLDPAGRLMLRGMVSPLSPSGAPWHSRNPHVWVTVDGQPITVLYTKQDNRKFATTLPDGAYRPGALVRLVVVDHNGKFVGFTDAPPPPNAPPTPTPDAAPAEPAEQPRAKSRGLINALGGSPGAN